MDFIVRVYNHVFYERADQRVNDWLLMKSPWPLFYIIMTYLIIIKIILPKYMLGRKPYELRTIIKWYNIVQIIGNAICTWGIATSGWTTTYHMGCMLPDYSMSPEPLRMLRFLWWTTIIKLLELLETMFFILRKKDNQASFLHVYHHISTLIIIWSAVKYVGGGITSFSPMINNGVHVIMYSYYLAASEGGPRLRAFLAKYKMWLTVMQMFLLITDSAMGRLIEQVLMRVEPSLIKLAQVGVITLFCAGLRCYRVILAASLPIDVVQFTLMLIYSAQVFLPSCPAPLGVTPMYFTNVIFVYYMFYKFFNENYKRKMNEMNNGKSVKIN